MIKLGKYRHYKGHICNVIGVAKHSENPEEELVVYSHPNEKGEDQLWVRPKSMFESDVEINGKIVKRFEYLGE